MSETGHKIIVRDIRNRLSLRKPQADSLELLAKIAEVGMLKKDADTAAQLEAVKAIAPSVTGLIGDTPHCLAGFMHVFGDFVVVFLNLADSSLGTVPPSLALAGAGC